MKVKELSGHIAKGVVGLSMINEDDVSALIEAGIKSSISDLLEEYITKEEKLLMQIMEIRLNYEPNTQKFRELSFKMEKSRLLKSAANRILHNAKREDVLAVLKDFVKEKFGSKYLDEFDQLQLSKKPVYSTSGLTH